MVWESTAVPSINAIRANAACELCFCPPCSFGKPRSLSAVRPRRGRDRGGKTKNHYVNGGLKGEWMPTDANGCTASRVERTNGFYSYKMEPRIDAGEIGETGGWRDRERNFMPCCVLLEGKSVGRRPGWESRTCRFSAYQWPVRLRYFGGLSTLLNGWIGHLGTEPGSFGNPNACQTRLRV